MRSRIYASIITIGDELLIGQVVDTNSAWMAQELNKIGISVKQRIAVGDNKEDILYALNETQKSADIILITGGLGPTADDITKPLLCEYFEGKMIVHQPTLDFIIELFEKKFKRPMLERNYKQAEVPDVCTVLMNEKGTAPGMLFTKDNKIFVALPGVPHEMKWIMEAHVLLYITEHCQTGFIVHKTMLTAGIGESYLAEKIKDLEEQLPNNIKLAYLPNYGMVRLRLTGYGTDKESLAQSIYTHFNLLKESLAEYLVAEEDLPLETVVGNLLKKNNKTIATAESCTGGLIAHLISSVPGASAYFKGGIVSYSNEIKTNLLAVNHSTIETSGAVSEETVKEMAIGAMKKLNTDYAIAVSGIMGPDGGTVDKPVGTVWIAVSSAKAVITNKYLLPFDRQRNTQQTAINGLIFLRKFIVENECG